jgi:hypothetical protein
MKFKKECKRDLFQNPNIPVCRYEQPVKYLNFADTVHNYASSGAYVTNTTSSFGNTGNISLPEPKTEYQPGNTGNISQKPKQPYVPQRQKPNISSLDDAAIEKANLVKASRIAYESNFDKAQAHLDENNIPYTIDKNLSNTEGLVLKNNNTNEIKVAYRGTKWGNSSDIVANGKIFGNAESTDAQFKTAKDQIKAVTEKYSQLPDELLGYSRGGSIAITQGNDFGIKTTTFNPLLNGNMVAKGDQGLHSIIRTTEDPVSVGTAFGTFKDVKSIYPKTDTINPVEAHTLDQFVDNNSARRQPVNSLEPNEIKPLSRGFAETFSTTQIGSGLAAGYLANQVVKQLDPHNKLGNQGQEVVSGSLAGGIGAGFSAGLSGTAASAGLFAPAIISGAAGMIAGAETQKAVNTALQKAGATQFEASETSSTVGGAVGGAATAVTAGLGTVAAGAEIGAAFAPETLGLSVLGGAVIGAGVAAYQNRGQIAKTVVSDVKQEVNTVENAVESGAKKVWNFLHG